MKYLITILLIAALLATAMGCNPPSSTHPCDISGDGKYDSSDYDVLMSAYDSMRGDDNWDDRANFNGDSWIDWEDKEAITDCLAAFSEPGADGTRCWVTLEGVSVCVRPTEYK